MRTLFFTVKLDMNENDALVDEIHLNHSYLCDNSQIGPHFRTLQNILSSITNLPG